MNILLDGAVTGDLMRKPITARWIHGEKIEHLIVPDLGLCGCKY